MSLARGKYGVEYDPKRRDRDSSGLGWVFVAVALVALVSLSWTLVKRMRATPADEAFVDKVSEAPPDAAPSAAATGETNRAAGAAVDLPPAPAPVVRAPAGARRPVKVKNLLMRLEEAEKSRNLEMAVSTIEALRALPGGPAADIDDALARRLGSLNVRRLFGQRNAQWVKRVTVKRGDSASRIAAENGSTLASLVKLNGIDASRIVLGQQLYVMDHPRFNLIVHRRARTADLSLNGKFFKRYDLQGEVSAKEGAYELPERKRAFFTNIGAVLKTSDQEELEVLLPVHTPVLVSEM